MAFSTKNATICLLIVMFLLGVYHTSTVCPRGQKEYFENGGGGGDSANGDSAAAADIAAGCPNMLIRRGASMVLVDTRDPTSKPVSFGSMNDYMAYLENQQKQSNEKNCPVLFLQEESNAQGEQVFRIRPTIDGTLNGLPATTTYVPGVVLSQLGNPSPPSPSPPQASPLPEGEHYSAFDPHGQSIGEFTALDAIHIQGEQQYMSPNAMDPNWGGNKYTESLVESGAYAGNYVSKVTLPKLAVA